MATLPMEGPRWADICDNEDQPVVIMPPTTEKIENGIKTTTYYKEKVDENTGQTTYVKVVECSRLLLVRRRISRKAKLRRGIPKFGVCEGKPPGPERGISVQSPDPILFEWEHERKDDDEEEEVSLLKMLKKNEQDALIQDIIPEHILKGESQGPKKKANKSLSHMDRRNDEFEDTPTIRILDIPRQTTFADLRELVRRFHSQRIKLPRDQNSENENRGFAFVTFDSHSDAEKAKDALNGHAYGTNILHCEWSRNYVNYLNANPAIKERMSSGLVRRAGRPRFMNSKKKGPM